MVSPGVLTAIASAIRVRGASWLKALIGRARENNATVEMELLSSVSQEFCEVWNGNSVVRSTGRSEIKQTIHFPAMEGDFSPESFIKMNPETWSEGYKLKSQNLGAEDPGSKKSSYKSLARSSEQLSESSPLIDLSKIVNSYNDHDAESQQSKDTIDPKWYKSYFRHKKRKSTVPLPIYKDVPPNISLNINDRRDSKNLWGFTVFISMSQVTVLASSGFIAYLPSAHTFKLIVSWPKLGFWLQVAGTIFLSLSLVLCAGIIDNAGCKGD